MAKKIDRKLDKVKTGKAGYPAFADPESVRSEYIKIRVTQAEKDFIEEEANRRGLGLAPFVRTTIITYLTNPHLLPMPKS